jgi:hypothetical protein
MTITSRARYLALALAATTASGCCSINANAIVVRDGTVSANADASTFNAAESLAQSLRRVEQDQLIALAVLNHVPVCELQKQLIEARAAWTKALCLVDLAKDVHEKLQAALKAGSPDAAAIQMRVEELNKLIKDMYAEIALGSRRIETRRK